MTATVLLIEDAEALAQIIARELESAGYRVLCAGDGLNGLALHERERPALVILDWMLPGMDGLDVLRRIRQVAPTPVLMLTARGEETDRVIGLELGADDYLTKPFGSRELVARVRAIIRRSELVQKTLAGDREQAAGVLVRGALRLDALAHLATLADHPLDLTPTEFSLLELLLRNPGRAFSRAYLIDTIWGQSYIGGDRSV
ncbi:MAG TPA: response regulator transcription factor, partial [Roseiflexaceae bacterium]|nr:response regulator transcription factor [Roseiflexaceae bacterium]